MRVDSLAQLESLFTKWRGQKQRRAEAIPEALLVRARKAVPVHGLRAVIQATRAERCRIVGEVGSSQARRLGSKHARQRSTIQEDSVSPAYSRLALPATSTAGGPLAEVETPTGVRLKVFVLTAETTRLLAALSGMGGAL